MNIKGAEVKHTHTHTAMDVTHIWLYIYTYMVIYIYRSQKKRPEFLHKSREDKIPDFKRHFVRLSKSMTGM